MPEIATSTSIRHETAKPSSFIQHVCQGHDVKARLQRIFGDDIIDLSDDCSVGPLVDVEAAIPWLRIRFWQRLRDSLNDSREALAPIEPAFEKDLVRLIGLGAGADEVVIWAGNNATEETLKRRVSWWLIGKRPCISEAGVLTNARPDEVRWTACLSDSELIQAYEARQAYSPIKHLKLAGEWERLRQSGQGLRTLERNALVDRPVWHHDGQILSGLKAGRVPVRHCISHLMVDTQQCAAFCAWRLSVLCQRGIVSMADGLCWKTGKC